MRAPRGSRILPSPFSSLGNHSLRLAINSAAGISSAYSVKTPFLTRGRSAILTHNPFMKTNRSLLLLIASVAPAALLGSWGCSKSSNPSGPSVVQDVKTTATDVAADVKTTAIDTWDSIKDFTFDRRSDFSASIGRMSASLDAKVADLKAKASTLPDAAAKDRDAAIKEYDAASADLKARLTDLGNATADTWADAKAKVSDAWQRVKADFDKINT